MKRIQFRAFALVGLLLSLTACGNKSGSAVHALMGFFSKGNSSGAGAQFKAVVSQQYQAAREIAVGQAWLARFSREAGRAPTALADPTYNISDENFTCTGAGTGVFDTSPTGATGTLDINCTASSADTFTCGGDSFTFHSGTFGLNLTLAETSMSIGLETNGKISGGDLGDNVDIACNFAFSLNLATLSASPEQSVTADCSSANLSCTIGGETLSCEDLMDAMKGSASLTCS